MGDVRWIDIAHCEGPGRVAWDDPAWISLNPIHPAGAVAWDFLVMAYGGDPYGAWTKQ
jgi:hypothetical protein